MSLSTSDPSYRRAEQLAAEMVPERPETARKLKRLLAQALVTSLTPEAEGVSRDNWPWWEERSGAVAKELLWCLRQFADCSREASFMIDQFARINGLLP